MNDLSADAVVAAVDPNESVLWSTRAGSIGLQEGIPHLAVLSLVFGFGVFWFAAESELVRRAFNGVPGKGVLFLFSFIGLIPAFVVTPFWLSYLGGRTFYGVTSQHLVWARRWPFKLQRKVHLSEISQLTRTELSAGRANFLFLWPRYDAKDGGMRTSKLEFCGINNPDAVEALIRKQREVCLNAAAGDQ